MNYNDILSRICLEMIDFYSGDPKRIQHFIKVHAFAKFIGEQEGLSEREMFILQSAAYLHDIGIKPAEEKYGYNNGKLQEQEGELPAREMLNKLKIDSGITERVVYLITHHHTYSDIDSADYQILVEADFLVNLYEDGCSKTAIESAMAKIFTTKTGKDLLKKIYNL